MGANGLVRVASHPRYPNRPGGVGATLAILSRLCAAPGHHFWHEDVSIRELLAPDTIISHAQITDVFLLGLAARRRGKIATLDQRLPADAISNGSASLERITP